MRTAFPVALIAVVMLGADSPAPGTARVGVVFAKGDAVLRPAPDASAEAVAKIPAGTRLVFHRVVVGSDGVTPMWFRTEPPGAAAAWIAASEATDVRARPGVAKPLPPIATTEIPALPASAKPGDGGVANEQLAILERFVSREFSDSKDDQTSATRVERAATFTGELK